MMECNSCKIAEEFSQIRESGIVTDDVALTKFLDRCIEESSPYFFLDALLTKEEINNIERNINISMSTTNGDTELVELTVRQVTLLIREAFLHGIYKMYRHLKHREVKSDHVTRN